MAEGFLGRWSKRKAGIEVEPQEKKVEANKETTHEIANDEPSAPTVEGVAEETSPPPTLEDVVKIDRFDPDFSAFMRPDVDPAVQQAALKKMFTDPHFNIMDGLDIYIDDYSKPDPLPPGMLERMVQSDMLNLLNKTTEGLAKEVTLASKQIETPDPNPNPELGAASLDLQKQSDLTSTQTIFSNPAEDAPQDLSSVPEQKKT